MIYPTLALTQLKQKCRGSRRQEHSRVVVRTLHLYARSRFSPFVSAIIVSSKKPEKLHWSLIHTKALQVSFHCCHAQDLLMLDVMIPSHWAYISHRVFSWRA